MTLLSETKIFVSVGQRIDTVGQKYPWPGPYVRLYFDGESTDISPAVARQLAKSLNAFARLIDPPKPRK